MNKSLNGKKILISAGASGIGWATAKICLSKGATVYICDIETKYISKIKKHHLNNKKLFVYNCDASNEIDVNELFKKILKKTKKLNDIILTFYGITYKPNVDDIRESPSIKIIKKISEKFDGIIQIVDPFVKMDLVKIKNVSFVKYKKGIKGSDLNIFLVKHSDFLKQKKPNGKIIDTTGIWYN